MKTISAFVIFLISIFSFTACTSQPSERPGDFNLSLAWNTGSLPPQYHYSYSINIQSSGASVFIYQAGYEEDEALRWQTDFTLDKNQMDDLYKYLVEKDLLRSNWREGQPSMGSSGTSIQITANGEEFQVPSISVLEQADRKIIQPAIDTINQLVPQNIWDEMNTRQDTYEKEFE